MNSVDDRSFESEVGWGAALVKFDMYLHKPSDIVQGRLELLEPEFPTVRFFRMNARISPKLAERIEVVTFPSVVVFRDGRIIGWLVGVKPVADYRKLLTKLSPNQA